MNENSKNSSKPILEPSIIPHGHKKLLNQTTIPGPSQKPSSVFIAQSLQFHTRTPRSQILASMPRISSSLATSWPSLQKLQRDLPHLDPSEGRDLHVTFTHILPICSKSSIPPYASSQPHGRKQSSSPCLNHENLLPSHKRPPHEKTIRSHLPRRHTIPHPKPFPVRLSLSTHSKHTPPRNKYLGWPTTFNWASIDSLDLEKAFDVWHID